MAQQQHLQFLPFEEEIPPGPGGTTFFTTFSVFKALTEMHQQIIGTPSPFEIEEAVARYAGEHFEGMPYRLSGDQVFLYTWKDEPEEEDHQNGELSQAA